MVYQCKSSKHFGVSLSKQTAQYEPHQSGVVGQCLSVIGEK